MVLYGLEFKPFEFLSYKFNGGIDLYFYENSWFRGEGNWTQNQEHRDPESQKARDNTYNMLIEHTLNFNKDFGKHHVDAVVGTTYQHHEWEGLWASRLNFPMTGNGDYFTVLNAGQSNQQNSNSISENVLADIRSCLVERRPVENFIHEAMLKNLELISFAAHAGGRSELYRFGLFARENA